MSRKRLMIWSTALLAASGIATALFGKGVCLLEPDCSPWMVALVLILFIGAIITFGVALDLEADEKAEEAARANERRAEELEAAVEKGAARGAAMAFRAMANLKPDELSDAVKRLALDAASADDKLLEPLSTTSWSALWSEGPLLRAALALVLLAVWIVLPLLLTGRAIELPFLPLVVSERQLGLVALLVVGLGFAVLSFRNVPRAASL